MLDIDYTGMFSYEKVKEYINTCDYNTNNELYKKLYDYYLDYHLTEFNTKQIIDIKIILGISHKYNYEYNKTKSLIYRLSNELIQARFHLAIPYLLFLKTKAEKETYIDECIDYYLIEDSELSLRSVCNFLEDVIELNNVDKLKYREKYADTCMIQAKNNTGIRANHWVCLALPQYKEIGAKKKYQEALKFYNNNIDSVIDEMGVQEFELGDTDLQKELYKHEQTIYLFIKNTIKDISDRIRALCTIIQFIGFGKHNYMYNPFYVEEKKKEHVPSLIDHCSIVTFSGKKVVKSESWEQKTNLMGREMHRKMTIEPAINGFLDSEYNKKDLINSLLNSKLIFEEDKVHIEKAIQFFLDKEFDVFIYIIIPNFEKLLRNVLTLNGIPEYTNKNADPKYQVTLNLTETITKIKEENLIGINLINKCSQLLNEEDYENYRNKLSHREDDSIFTKTVAYDLFLLLIQLTQTYSDEYIDVLKVVTTEQDNA